MARNFYPRLAATNLRKNAQTYFPYILTCICATSMYYIVHSLSVNPDAGTGTLQFVLTLGVYVMAIFSVLFLFYTNSFLMKRRKKEFGLFNILGMEKKHLFRIIFFENLYTFVISMALGLFFGILFSKLVHLLLLNMLGFSIRFGFFISVGSIQATLLLFGGIFVLLLLFSLLQIQLSRPIELIHGGETGEKEPKAKWVLAILGFLCLGVAYFISVTIENPVMVLILFFLAVVLVIIGTYLLFMAGGVAFLKLLKKNKGYYYKPNHFISVSGMMYRMKQNAAGLATICILSTMVLVMISSTAALYFGLQDSLETQFPREIIVNVYGEDNPGEAFEEIRRETLSEFEGLSFTNEYHYREFSLYGTRQSNELVLFDGTYDFTDPIEAVFLPMEDFTDMTGISLSLSKDELLLISTGKPYGNEVLTLEGMTFQVQEKSLDAEAFPPFSIYTGDIATIYFLITSDMEVFQKINDRLYETEGYYSGIRLIYGFDLGANDETTLSFHSSLAQKIRNEETFHGSVNSRAFSQHEFLELYGGLFFLGLFLGFVFILATVLIIYYKQISEGYDDQNRFRIMKKVGLGRREAKKSINSQILTMFFFPLVVACIHIVFAFPLISRLLAMIGLMSQAVFVFSTLLSVLVFALFYVAIYGLTAKVYYKIVDAE